MSKKIILSILIVGFSTLLSAQDKLTLGKAIALGLENSYGLAISEEESKVAGLNNSWGAVGAYPTIVGNADFDFSSNIAESPAVNNTGAGASIGANWTVFNGFTIKTSKRIAESKYHLAKNSEVIQIENSVSDIVLAYYSYIIEKELLLATQTLYDLSKDRYERDQVSAEIGAKGTYELVQSESAYLMDRQNVLLQERGVKVAIQNLNLAMSVEAHKQWDIDRKIEVPSKEYKLGDLLDRMTSSNSTLKHQYISHKVTEEGIELAKGEMMPKLSVSAGGRYNLSSLSTNSSATNSFSPYAGVSLSATLFDGKMKQRNLSIAKIQTQIGAIAIEQIKREMTTLLINQLDNYNYSREVLLLAGRELEVAEINLKLSLEKFNNGSISSFDYRTVHVDYLNAAINQQQLIFALLSSNVELTRLIGGIMQEYE